MDDSLVDLEAKRAEYEESLEQVELLLLDDPTAADILQMRSELKEAIELTTSLINDAKSRQAAAAASPALPTVGGVAGSGSASAATVLAASGAAAAGGLLPELLPTVQLPSGAFLQTGGKCQARFVDGQWYDAIIDTIKRVQGTLCFEVTFVGYDDKHEVGADGVRPHDRKRKHDSGADAASVTVLPIPKALQINPDDPEKVKIAKKKRIHAIKRLNKFKQIDDASRDKQSAWKDFVHGKGARKKTGFFTGRRKESIFKSPDTVSGKVGVTGSGADVTPNPERQKMKKSSVDLQRLA
mmetsp:Transcript_52294/g.131328  ORF Transcript_52294/g.131328 Transcript_52294/m.131328 type:complete len:297 (-) Transcript_52294:41-931(-)